MGELIRKGYRVDEETDAKIKELMSMYNMKSENDLFRAIVNEIYELKKGKALVPFEKYEDEKIQLQKALYEIGRLKGILEEKEKQLQKVEQEKENEKKKGFWARLFGL